MKATALISGVLALAGLAAAGLVVRHQLISTIRQRITSKAESVKSGLQLWTVSGRDPSAIVREMQQTVMPLLNAGKAAEGEAALDRLLARLQQKPAATAPPLPRDGKARAEASDHFTVWISKTDGSGRKVILSDPRRQITHTRVSPDLQWVVFTTYNNPGDDGLAKEGRGYANTEVCLFKIGGTEIKTIAGPVAGEMNANASFSPDGKRIIFISTRSGKGARLHWYEVETGVTSEVPAPPELHHLSDPHEVAGRIVFPSRPDKADAPQGIWVMNTDGTAARQVTFPKKAANAPIEEISQGDYDPRLSPDGTRFSILRNVGGAFHVVIADVATGAEKDLTEPLFPERKQTAEGVAAWSPDGSQLVFRHIALPREGTQGVGIYVMNADGSGRRKVPIARGEFPHVQPEFLPGASGDEARIIYQTEKDARF